MNLILYDFEVQNLLKNGRGQIRRAIPIKFLPGYNPEWTGYQPIFEYGEFYLANSKGEPATKEIKCPFNVREEYWVREMWRERWGMSYANCGCGSAYPVDEVREIGYKDGVSVYFAGLTLLCPDECTIKSDNDWSSWKSPVTMPREASRLTIVPDKIWVERIQHISNADIRAEGLAELWSVTHRLNFQSAFDSHAKPGYKFADNPVVWCGKVRVK
jgi:hypothetical protein